MRPILKIDDIRDLHDARYCAAVSIGLLGFKMTSSPAALPMGSIAEIMEWLSGPEAVGEFEYETPDEINLAASKARLTYVSLPLDYPFELAQEIQSRLILRSSAHLDEGRVERFLEAIEVLPSAYLEFPVSEGELLKGSVLSQEELFARALVRADDPDTIYALLKKKGIQPWGFTLGDFIVEDDGSIAYSNCDDFVEQFFQLTEAAR